MKLDAKSGTIFRPKKFPVKNFREETVPEKKCGEFFFAPTDGDVEAIFAADFRWWHDKSEFVSKTCFAAFWYHRDFVKPNG